MLKRIDGSIRIINVLIVFWHPLTLEFRIPGKQIVVYRANETFKTGLIFVLEFVLNDI